MKYRKRYKEIDLLSRLIQAELKIKSIEDIENIRHISKSTVHKILNDYDELTIAEYFHCLYAYRIEPFKKIGIPVFLKELRKTKFNLNLSKKYLKYIYSIKLEKLYVFLSKQMWLRIKEDKVSFKKMEMITAFSTLKLLSIFNLNPKTKCVDLFDILEVIGLPLMGNETKVKDKISDNFYLNIFAYDIRGIYETVLYLENKKE